MRCSLPCVPASLADLVRNPATYESLVQDPSASPQTGSPLLALAPLALRHHVRSSLMRPIVQRADDLLFARSGQYVGASLGILNARSAANLSLSKGLEGLGPTGVAALATFLRQSGQSQPIAPSAFGSVGALLSVVMSGPSTGRPIGRLAKAWHVLVCNTMRHGTARDSLASASRKASSADIEWSHTDP